MNAIHWPLLSLSQSTNKDFVQFWDQFYSGYSEELYQANIGQELTENRITEWFIWKNGTPLSADKTQTIRLHFTPNEHISPEANSDTLAAFLNRPGDWRVKGATALTRWFPSRRCRNVRLARFSSRVDFAVRQRLLEFL